MIYLQANTFIMARQWPKLTHFHQLHKTQKVIAFKFTG